MESSNLAQQGSAPFGSPPKQGGFTDTPNKSIKEENEREISRLHGELQGKLEASSESSTPLKQSTATKPYENKRLIDLHTDLQNKLDITESEESYPQDEEIEEEKFDDLDKIPDATLVEKYKRIRNQLDRGPIGKPAQTKLLNELQRIDEALQKIEKKELEKYFGGAYETYNYILRRFYEKLLNKKNTEYKKIEGHLKEAESELSKLEEEYARTLKKIDELKGKNSNEIKTLEQEVDGYKQNITGMNKQNTEATKKMLTLTEENEKLKHEKAIIEKKLKGMEQEVNKTNELLREIELEKKSVEIKIGITLEKLEDLKRQDEEKDLQHLKLDQALNQLQSSKEILQSYEQREKSLKQEVEESKTNLKEKASEINQMKEKHSEDMTRLSTTLKKLQEENQVLKQKEDFANQNISLQEAERKKWNQELEEKKGKYDTMKKAFDEEAEKLRLQKDELNKKQGELDRLREIDRDLKIHKEQIRKMVEEYNFKKEQVLKAIQDLASKGEKFEEEKKKFEQQVQEKTESLKQKKEIKKREDSGNKDFDTLYVCLGFLVGILVTILVCWLVFGGKVQISDRLNGAHHRVE